MSKPGILFNELIDQYKLEKHLAQKRVTDQYLAFDVDENQQVVIEILLPSLANQQTYANRFISKIQSVAQLNHPHIAQIFQVGVAPNNRPYVARENVDGIMLGERLKALSNQEHPVHSIYALKLVRQIADALALAERLDIFHHDLHPDNILFQSDGKIMLIDLGIPRVKKIDNENFAGNIAFDTRYWSPEQVQNKPIDARSHIFSLGVILFEILTGHVLESGNRNGSALPFVAGKSALDKLRSDLSPETIRLVQKCLKTSQWGRYQNSSELLKAIDEAIQAEEFVLRSGDRVRHRSTTTNLLLTVGAPILLLLIATAVGLVLMRNANNANTLSTDIDEPLVAIIAETTTPTPIPITATPTLRPEQTTVAASVPFIQLIQPAPEMSLVVQDSIDFSWTWDNEIEQNQAFFIYGFDNGQQFVMGQLTPNESDEIFQTAVPSAIFPSGSGQYEWQVVLINTVTRNAVAESRLRPISVELLATATPLPTETPAPTVTPTPTLTPTPVPQVVVNLSSVSLRTGPSTRFEIVLFLEFGDVLNVLTLSPNGEWYQVVTEIGERGWVHVSTVEAFGDSNLIAIPTAVTVPPIPTVTSSPIPTAVVATPTPVSDDGGGNPNPPPPPPPPPTNPPPPTKTPPPP